MKQTINLSKFRTLRHLVEGKVVLQGVTGKIFMVKPFKNVVITDHFVPFEYCLVTYDNNAMYIGRAYKEDKKKAIFEARLQNEFDKKHTANYRYKRV